MKLSTIINCTLSASLFLSCSQMRASEKKTKKVTIKTARISGDTVDLDENPLIKKKGADNHELADANVDDQEIRKEIGETELDDELPGPDKEGVPYSRDFLLKKNTKRMQFWVDYFTKQQRERFQRFINNGEEYRHHIEKIFEEHGLPKELYFVGLIESGYYLGARSHAAAVGPWQFIRGTAKRYGLKTSQEIDERQDIFKATRAAAMYFKDMHNVFSSWELALAGYNAGEYGIIRRIMKYGTRDFYQLSRNKYLPSETINYVPKVLAAMHVVQNAQKYGFMIPQKKYRLFDRTELKPIAKSTSLTTIAHRLGVEVELLKRLNPELRKKSTPRHFAGTYYLRVPRSQNSKIMTPEVHDTVVASPMRPERRIELARRIAEVKQRPTSAAPAAAMVRASIVTLKPHFHTVKKGETILSLSRRYKMPPRKLASYNNLPSWKTRLQKGQRIALTESKVVDRTPEGRASSEPIVYKVRPGDSLTNLARVFAIKVTKLKRANKLKRGTITVGQRIVLPGTQKGIYIVKRGDGLIKLAKKFDQPIEALVKINALKRRSVYPGQKIIVNMD